MVECIKVISNGAVISLEKIDEVHTQLRAGTCTSLKKNNSWKTKQITLCNGSVYSIKKPYYGFFSLRVWWDL